MGGRNMNSMIYYPGFEVENETWLKFSLIYFDELRPIIPYMNADDSEYLSNTAIRIANETNLINPYRPLFEEGSCASIIACEEFQKYLEHPEWYSSSFGYRYGYDIRRKWQNPSYQTCRLYEGKFSNTFYDFCIKNHIAKAFNNGIMISKDLAFIYMSFLADTISKNNEIEMFTDISKYNTLLLKNDQKITNSQGFEYKTAKINIELNIPANIKDIPMEIFINLRKQPSFNECRRAYVHEIDNLVKAKNDKNHGYSLDQLLSIKRDFVRICGSAFNMLASVVLSVSSIASLANGDVNIPALLAAAYSDAYSLKSLSESRDFFVNLQNKVQAKRYLAKIDRAITRYYK